MFLTSFHFPDRETEYDVRLHLKTTYDLSMYPFFILSEAGLGDVFFRPITILYGGNGSGKSTALNVIAEKVGLKRGAAFNRTRFFDDYLRLCSFSTDGVIPENSRIVTSDDVFDMMLDVRSLNDGIQQKRDELVEDYFKLKKERFQISSLDDWEHLRLVNRSRQKTLSRFVEGESGRTVRERSNGESAIMFFRDRMDMDTLCLLDEPENSLSPENQLALADYLAESARYCGNQLIISTHSPFLLALPGAKIIDLDEKAREVDSWTQLKNPRVYYEFFKKHAKAFGES